MPTSADILWFKQQFQAQIEPALAGTPISVDMIVALACQETGHIWPVLRKKNMPVPQILALCVGDTIDAMPTGGRRAFPQTKAALLEKPNGQQMFDIARAGLVEMARHINGYAGAVAKPHKFCHGFGLFQLDLQFFIEDPQYFLQQRYEHFDQTLGKCIDSLKRALRKLDFQNRELLSDLEMAAVGIAYNTGGYKAGKGLKQGHFNGTKFYGECIFDFLRLSQTVALPGAMPVLSTPRTGEAILPPPTPLTATGPFMRVDTKTTILRVRSEARISRPVTANVKGELPDGHPVRAITGNTVNGFIEIQTSLNGAFLQGFASAQFLVLDAQITEVPLVKPAAAPPQTGIVAVTMPKRSGTIIKRSQDANAHSLNEPKQPTRKGATPGELRAEIATIIDWLAVDKLSHKRYQPRAGVTFCNIYSHDFCTLANVYLPRVWWSQRALIDLAQGRKVEPLIGNSINEMRANDLFRWLRDFGPAFGWRQTGDLNKLQQAANQGAIGLIVARRKEDGRSGHIVVVVPETAEHSARRDASGVVTTPLQSQAGVSNFRYGRGRADWWKGQEFAESAYWIHA